MKRAYSRLAAASIALLGACGGGNNHPGNNYADAGPRADAAALPDGGGVTDASAPGDGSLADAMVDNGGPLVEVLSPAATPSGSFASSDIVTTDQLTVRCKVTANAASGVAVDTGSVKVAVLGAGNKSISAQALPTAVEGEYEALVSLDGFINGALTARCSARDLGDPPITNSAENATYLDLGPTILMLSPMAGSSVAHSVDIAFRVDPAPVAMGDTGAAPDTGTVTAAIAGVDLSGDLTEDPAGSRVFKATVKFDDARFTPALDGAQTLTVTAANSRSTVPVTRTSETAFDADGSGPSISIKTPTPGQLIAGIFTVQADIADSAGVDDSSVVATIAGTHEFALSSTGGGTYSGTFDSRALSDTMVFPTLVVRAKDSVGNQSSLGEVVTLDNRPPIADLDPPDMREAFVDTGTGNLICSSAFDPLGTDAVDDGESVGQLDKLRARIEDRGNGPIAPQGGVEIPYAGVGRVELFVLDDSSRALVVDTDGDGVCDNIDPNIVPTSVPMASNEAAEIDLVGLAPGGSADFVGPASPVFGGGVEADCNDGTEMNHPAALCDLTSPITRITKTPIGSDPVIFSIPPATSLQCMGNPMDAVATNIADGWACVAVRVVDNLGNVGVSAPLRVCIDSNGDMSECGAWGTVATSGLPDCTGTWDAGTGVTDSGTACTSPPRFSDFPALQLRRNDQ